jgi:cysteine dioxygenase
MAAHAAILERYITAVRIAYREDRAAIAAKIADPEIGVETLAAYIQPPGSQPYGRELIYQDDEVEVIVMNWAEMRHSLPHDHGESEGWVRVLKGSPSHAYYDCSSPAPVLAQQQLVPEGTVFYAPKNLVHHMGNPSNSPVITLHFYFPPIHRMEVFDLAARRAAIVSDDCGAWWPDAEQLVSSKQLDVLAASAG